MQCEDLSTTQVLGALNSVLILEIHQCQRVIDEVCLPRGKWKNVAELGVGTGCNRKGKVEYVELSSKMLAEMAIERDKGNARLKFGESAGGMKRAKR